MQRPPDRKDLIVGCCGRCLRCMWAIDFPGWKSQESLFKMCTRPFECLLVRRYQHWQDRWGLPVWRSQAVADFKIYAEAGFMQGRMLLSVSQTVAGSGGVFFRLKGAANAANGNRFLARRRRWSHGQCCNSSFHSIIKSFCFRMALVTLNRCFLRVK